MDRTVSAETKLNKIKPTIKNNIYFISYINYSIQLNIIQYRLIGLFIKQNLTALFGSLKKRIILKRFIIDNSRYKWSLVWQNNQSCYLSNKLVVIFSTTNILNFYG